MTVASGDAPRLVEFAIPWCFVIALEPCGCPSDRLATVGADQLGGSIWFDKWNTVAGETLVTEGHCVCLCRCRGISDVGRGECVLAVSDGVSLAVRAKVTSLLAGVVGLGLAAGLARTWQARFR